jgi:hypothetical protein
MKREEKASQAGSNDFEPRSLATFRGARPSRLPPSASRRRNVARATSSPVQWQSLRIANVRGFEQMIGRSTQGSNAASVIRSQIRKNFQPARRRQSASIAAGVEAVKPVAASGDRRGDNERIHRADLRFVSVFIEQFSTHFFQQTPFQRMKNNAVTKVRSEFRQRHRVGIPRYTREHGPGLIKNWRGNVKRHLLPLHLTPTNLMQRPGTQIISNQPIGVGERFHRRFFRNHSKITAESTDSGWVASHCSCRATKPGEGERSCARINPRTHRLAPAFPASFCTALFSARSSRIVSTSVIHQ